MKSRIAGLCALTVGALISTGASAAVRTKNISVSSLVTQPTPVKDFFGAYEGGGQAAYAIPAFNPKSGNLYSITIGYDEVRNLADQVSRSFSTSSETLTVDAYVDLYSFNINLDPNYLALGATNQPLNLTVPGYATSTSYTVPFSYSYSQSFDVGSDGFNRLVNDGLTIQSGFYALDLTDGTQKVTSRGSALISVSYNYTLPGAPLHTSPTSSPQSAGLLAQSAAAAGAVPEPASWAMMIGGFGMVGGAMRRRRSTASFA